MTRILRSLGFILALTTAVLGVGAFTSISGSPVAAQSENFTPLPPGWELCILGGLSAPATAANVADLDEWQAAEGGSTNNTAAFNPYNTLRMTDVTGASLPGATSSNGFPAFPTWAAGCAATVATLFQPNMWVITAALRAGDVTPPADFLAVVDQSSWCAPSPDGVPCYVDAMESTPGSLALAVPSSSALTVFGNVDSDLQSYQQSIGVVTNEQNQVDVDNVALASSESRVETAQGHFGTAAHALEGFAVSEYVSSGLYSGAPLENGPETQTLSPNTPQSSDGVVAQQYVHLAASDLVAKSDAAAAAVNHSEQRRKQTASALAQAATRLTTDEAAESRDLLQLTSDLAILEHAGACDTVTIIPPAGAGSASAGSTTTTTTTTTTLPISTATTTTGPVPPATTSTTSTTSTTTTSDPADPPTSTTTSTTIPPTTTTTTTVPPTTTTTTPAAVDPSAAPTPPAAAAGISGLQGCVATFAPSSSA
jgi:hypothetical protein